MLCAWLIVFVGAAPNYGQRMPVWPQIDLPHPYYYREMYLPQLTSGPGSLAWASDSRELIYSMAGSLWRQKLDSKEAVHLTDGPGYDYQPDCSPDGKKVVYTSYQKDAMELWLLDLESGKTTQLTAGGAVNLEPRWSPDSKRLAWVSTQYNKRFHIFLADVVEDKLKNVVRLTGETTSPLPRYYYSAYDMEISPVWTRDGTEILFVSNRGHIHGAGGFWRMRAEPGAEAREIHYEETNWKARPDFSPDGSRMVYSSYLGGQWHNLWLMPANGGDAFPITYNDWDSVQARWSPDGTTVAFIANPAGTTDTRIELRTIPGGAARELKIETRKYLAPRGTIHVRVLDGQGAPLPARVSITDQNGRFHAPASAWIHADDGYDRGRDLFEAHYFHLAKAATVDVPSGKIRIVASKGLEYRPVAQTVDVSPGDSKIVTIQLSRIEFPAPRNERWVSADLHVHMNYGGNYQNTLERLAEQADAENLAVVNNLVVNKEQRFPDIASAGKSRSLRDSRVTIVSGQEFHTSYWGHRGIVGLNGGLLLPGYAGYPNTAAASLYPMNADVYDMAHAQGALVGAVHPFDEEPNPFADPPQRITDELPVDAALGKLDYMEIVGFSDHKSTAAVWYRLLNLGFRIPAGAGTDATTNYAAPIRGMAGFDRVYALVPAQSHPKSWMDALRRGHTFATNGPLLNFTLGGEAVGSELKLEAARKAVPFTARLRSIVPLDHLEVVCNGRVVKNLKLARDAAEVQDVIPIAESGWCLLRAWSDKPEYPVLDGYAYATTSPVYVQVAGVKPRSPGDAKYFAAWIDRIIETTGKYPDWNSAAEKELVMNRLRSAKEKFEAME